MFSTVNFATIKGLQPQFPILGYIKIGILGPERTSKGGNKFRVPEKLEYFRITLRVRDANGQFAVDEEVHKAIGEKPTELYVTLLYDDPSLNCPARLNCYVGSKRWCHGNGEQALRLDAKGIYREQACPCPLLTAPEQAEQNRGKGQNELLRCKPNGSLGVQLPYKQSSVGIYRFRTTSVESIQSILTVQGAILMRTGGVLAGVPLRLILYPATDNTPGGASRSWKVTLDLPQGGWDAVDEAAREIVKARATSRLSMKAIEAQARRQMKALTEGTDEADQIIDELFPKPLTVIDGLAVLDEEPDGDSGQPPIEIVTEPEPQPQKSQPAPEPADADRKESAKDQGGAEASGDPPPPDAVLVFTEMYAVEGKVGAAETNYAAVADQIAALKVIMKRKGYPESKLKRPLEQFSREHRKAFFDNLMTLPDAEAELPWGK